MFNKQKLLKTIAELFSVIDAFPDVNIHKLPMARKKHLHASLNKVMADLNAIVKLVRHSMPTDSRFFFLSVDEDGDKYLFKPYKVTDFAYDGYPVVYLNKKVVGAFRECVEILNRKGYEVEIINGIIPFARWGAYSHKYRLLENHSRGKSIDFCIKGLSPSESFRIVKEVFSGLDRCFLFIELPTHVHFQFAQTPKCIFMNLEQHTFYSCNKQFKTMFFSPNQYQLTAMKDLSKHT